MVFHWSELFIIPQHHPVKDICKTARYSSFKLVLVFQRLFAENKEKLINGALTGLLAQEGDQNIISIENLEAQFHALRRLVASKAGFGAFTALPK